MEIENYYKKRKRFYDYVAGFTDGEGSFTISVKKEPTTRFGYAIDPEFKVSQLKEKGIVLEFVKSAIGCGRIFDKPTTQQSCVWPENMQVLSVRNRQHLVEKVIPFFRKHQLIVKQKEFEKFARVVGMLEKKEHATRDGFENILKVIFEDNPKNRKYQHQEILDDMRPSETIR